MKHELQESFVRPTRKERIERFIFHHALIVFGFRLTLLVYGRRFWILVNYI